MTVWRNLSLTPTAKALATSYAREDNTVYIYYLHYYDNSLLCVLALKAR